MPTTTSDHQGSVGARTSARRDVVTDVIGLLLLGGVLADGWAHANRPGLESFFTPWHGILYSAAGLMAVWLGLLCREASKASSSPGRGRWAPPPGYGLALVGGGVFVLGGVSDLAWHELFGIEVAVDALVSPTHLLLGAGGVLVVSAPMRSQGVLRPGAANRWTAPATASLLLTLGVTVFFLMYTSAFADAAPVKEFVPTPEGAPGHWESELHVVAGLAAYLVTTVLLVLAVLALSAGRGGAPRGAAVLVVATVALVPVVVIGFDRTELAGALGAIAGATAYEALGGPSGIARSRHASWAAPALLIGLAWSGQLAAYALTDGLGWPVSLWSGAVVLSAALAAAMAVVVGLATPPRSGEARVR